MNKWTQLSFISLILLTNKTYAVENSTFNVGGAGMITSYNDSNETPYKINLGYSLNDNFSAELNYFDFGISDLFDHSGNLSATGYSVEVIAKYPINDFSLYAKAGNMWWKGQGNIKKWGEVGSPIERIDMTGSDVIYGIGAGCSITSYFSIKIEYQHSQVNANNVNLF